ncbi:MAG: phage protease [Pseudomonadota bacterium]|jgi:phage I-like protein
MPAAPLAPTQPAPAEAAACSRALALPLAAQAEGSDAPQWVHLLPAGTFAGRDGRGPYTLDADAVLAAFAAHGGDLPLDYEHQTLDAASKAGPVPVAGWIEALEARTDGIWGRVRWTAQAAELLAARAYRYLSPVFRYLTADARVVALDGAALTHTPNLAALQAAASQRQPESTPAMSATPTAPESKPASAQAAMSLEADALERLRALLGQPGLSSAAELLAAAQALQQRLSESEASAQAAQAAQAALQAQLAQVAKEQAAAAAEAAVQAAMSAGKVPPAMLVWARAYASKDPAGFAQWAAAAPSAAPSASNSTAAAAASSADPSAVARAAQAWQDERERAGERVSFAAAVAHVMGQAA